jgi:hypothetical protein
MAVFWQGDLRSLTGAFPQCFADTAFIAKRRYAWAKANKTNKSIIE